MRCPRMARADLPTIVTPLAQKRARTIVPVVYMSRCDGRPYPCARIPSSCAAATFITGCSQCPVRWIRTLVIRPKFRRARPPSRVDGHPHKGSPSRPFSRLEGRSHVFMPGRRSHPRPRFSWSRSGLRALQAQPQERLCRDRSGSPSDSPQTAHRSRHWVRLEATLVLVHCELATHGRERALWAVAPLANLTAHPDRSGNARILQIQAL